MNNRIEINETYVTKQFRDRISFDHEVYALEVLKDTGLVPKILQKEEMTLRMERMPGMTLREVLKEEQSIHTLLRRIMTGYETLLETFNRKTGKYPVLEDLNPGNILLADDQVDWIDFEQYHFGTKQEAVTALWAMLMCLDLSEDDLSAVNTFIPGELRSAAVQSVFLTKERRTAMKSVRRASCVILAGGASSRMQGYPKGLLHLSEYTFTEQILYRMQMFDRIFISANTEEYARFGYPLIPDIDQGIGPLGALHACLSSLRDPLVFVLPCDMPLLRTETVLHLFAERTEEDAVILSCHDRIYPTVGIYRKEVLPVVEEQIRKKDFRMRSLLERLHVRYCDIDDPQEVININTPDDLSLLKTKF